MGGNVIFGANCATKITKEHDRNLIVHFVEALVLQLTHTYRIYDRFDNSLFSGSAYYYIHTGVDFFKYRKSLGDIDIKVDKNKLDELEKILFWYKVHYDCIDYKKSGNQIISLWRIFSTDINLQIDFEGVEFENGLPSEWAKFSYSNADEDFCSGIKGVYHKLLLRACTATTVGIFAIRNKDSSIKYIEESSLAFSIHHGLREKFKFKYYSPFNEVDRVKIKESLWITDKKEIIKSLFKVYDETDSIDSFKSVCRLIRKQNSEDRKKILQGFERILFGDAAQVLYRDDLERDSREKKEMIKLLYLEIGEDHVFS